MLRRRPSTDSTHSGSGSGKGDGQHLHHDAADAKETGRSLLAQSLLNSRNSSSNNEEEDEEVDFKVSVKKIHTCMFEIISVYFTFVCFDV